MAITPGPLDQPATLAQPAMQGPGDTWPITRAASLVGGPVAPQPLLQVRKDEGHLRMHVCVDGSGVLLGGGLTLFDVLVEGEGTTGTPSPGQLHWARQVAPGPQHPQYIGQWAKLTVSNRSI
jgi:hypothetical protein